MMKVYVASHDRWAGYHVADVLERHGHAITSMWLYKEFNPTEHHTEAERAEIASDDFADVMRSDAVVLVAGPDRYSGGKFVEAGIAIGAGKKVVVVGRRENMLMWLPSVSACTTPDDAAKLLGVAP